MCLYAKTGIRLEIVWRTDNNKLEWTTRKMLEQHRQMKGNMIQFVSRLMAFDIDFYFRIAKVSVSAAKVKLNL